MKPSSRISRRFRPICGRKMLEIVPDIPALFQPHLISKSARHARSGFHGQAPGALLLLRHTRRARGPMRAFVERMVGILAVFTVLASKPVVLRIAVQHTLRNRRRSAITLIAIGMAVLILVVVRGTLNGLQTVLKDK